MLIIFITPNTSVSPEAIKAYTPPVKMPVMIASTTMIPMVIYFPGIEVCRRRRTPRHIAQAHPDRLGRERERGTGAACQAGRYPSPRACLPAWHAVDETLWPVWLRKLRRVRRLGSGIHRHQ